ncbi:MAG TPA: DNA polymerase III subunit delta' [Clostridia bacterium]|nr:DNA polymerase III subunit delta' [Clostridia bacterium]
MGFNDIAGQRVIVESLRNAVKNNMISNGYIFSGPKGCGKKLMAFIFSMAVNCTGEAPEKPCGSCSSCIRLKSGNHPNVEFVRPTGMSIKIRQIRQIVADTAKKPFESGYKAVIIENAEKMTQDAQDAFLKTLEEPPGNTVFLLLAENHNLLLPTIVSRCQVYQFKPVPLHEMKAFIEARYDFQPSDIDEAVRYSKGITGTALELLQNRDGVAVRAAYIEILEKALEGNWSEAQLQVPAVVETKEAAERFLEFAQVWFRDILVLRELQGQSDELVVNAGSLEKLSRHNSALTEGKLNSIIEIVRNTARYVRYNVGIKNSIDGMLFNIAEVSLDNG